MTLHTEIRPPGTRESFQPFKTRSTCALLICSTPRVPGRGYNPPRTTNSTPVNNRETGQRSPGSGALKPSALGRPAVCRSLRIGGRDVLGRWDQQFVVSHRQSYCPGVLCRLVLRSAYLGCFFRSQHGSRKVCMLLTLKVILREPRNLIQSKHS